MTRYSPTSWCASTNQNYTESAKGWQILYLKARIKNNNQAIPFQILPENQYNNSFSDVELMKCSKG